MTTKTLLLLFVLSTFSINVKGQNTDYYTEGEDFTADMGFQSDYHKANVGKIVFLKTKPETNDNNPPVFSSFQAGEEIFAMMYMPTCVMNFKVYKDGKEKKAIKNKTGKVRVDVYIDGVLQKYSLNNYNFIGQFAPKTYIKQVVYGVSKEYAKENIADFVTALNGLSAGEHKIRLELFGDCNENHAIYYSTKTPIATGEFTYVKTAGSKIKYGALFDNIKAGMNDKDLETKAFKTIKEYKTPTTNAYSCPKLASDKMKIISEDWVIVKHPDTGVILSRMLACAVPVIRNGSCYVQMVGVYQDYEGSGYQKSFSKAVFLANEDYHSRIKSTDDTKRVNILNPIDCE